MVPSKIIAFICCSLIYLLTPVVARAELDPELAAVGPKNNQVFFLGGNIGFGQSYATGGSSPDIFFKASVEPGFMFPRDSWTRFEASLEVGTGSAGFQRQGGDKENVDLSIPLLALAKFGYGHSIGGNAFFVTRAGIGPISMKYEGKDGSGNAFATPSILWGVASTIGCDFVGELAQNLDFVAGVSLMHAQLTVDKVTSGGTEITVNESVNLNIPQLHLGLRLAL